VGFILSGMVLILVGRALNIFPLAALINRQQVLLGVLLLVLLGVLPEVLLYTDLLKQAARAAAAGHAPSVAISPKEQFIIWFSGLRGAIAFSLVLNMQSHALTAVAPETKSVRPCVTVE